jgi:heat-inducible transcriptional repressor
VTRTVRLLAQLTRQVAVVQYPSLTRSAVRHIELVPIGPERLLLVIITNTGRVEQRAIEMPQGFSEESIAQLRALLNAHLDGCWLTDVPGVVAEVPDRVSAEERPLAATILSVLLETLIEKHEEKIVIAGAANLARADLSQSLRDVLEALEEQVVLMRLLGEVSDPTSLTVRIGTENPHESLFTTSVVATGYGAGDQVVARLGVLGPTRMDYPGTMGAVRAVARYVGQILAGS